MSCLISYISRRVDCDCRSGQATGGSGLCPYRTIHPTSAPLESEKPLFVRQLLQYQYQLLIVVSNDSIMNVDFYCMRVPCSRDINSLSAVRVGDTTKTLALTYNIKAFSIE